MEPGHGSGMRDENWEIEDGLHDKITGCKHYDCGRSRHSAVGQEIIDEEEDLQRHYGRTKRQVCCKAKVVCRSDLIVSDE